MHQKTYKIQKEIYWLGKKWQFQPKIHGERFSQVVSVKEYEEKVKEIEAKGLNAEEKAKELEEAKSDRDYNIYKEMQALYNILVANVKEKDVKKFEQNAVDLYITCLKQFVKNPTLHDDENVDDVAYMDVEAQERLDFIKENFVLTDDQNNSIEDTRNEVGNHLNSAQNNISSDIVAPTPTPRQPTTGNKVRNEVAIYQPDEKTSPDEIIDEGSSFIQAGKDNQGAITVDGEKLQQGSNMLYNIAFAVGIVVAVGIGSYLGIKFMMGGAEEKASIKETLIPYFVGVIIMFSSFTIWKLVLVLLQSIDNI